jgi:eukaryotic-like serine/threonine-protein kinase
MPRFEAERDLLFGLLAFQTGLIDQTALVKGLQTCTGVQEKSLADILDDQGVLDAEGKALIEALASKHLGAHGGDHQKSLGSLTAAGSAREILAQLGNPTPTASLARVDSDSTIAASDGQTQPPCPVFATGGKRFRLLRPHAKGGLGAVFVALDTELNREVALKQILDRHADDLTSRSRFILEAEITGGLEHPGIVPVYGLGIHGNGRPYYAMRYIRGDSLKEAIENFHAPRAATESANHTDDRAGIVRTEDSRGSRDLELRKLLRRFLDVCNAIDYAHSRGVLHRDIKPANIILGQHGETLVVDWGLAKVTGKGDPAGGERTMMPKSGSGSTETLPGSAMGTPAYMSPEQARGEIDQLGPRSDV